MNAHTVRDFFRQIEKDTAGGNADATFQLICSTVLMNMQGINSAFYDTIIHLIFGEAHF